MLYAPLIFFHFLIQLTGIDKIDVEIKKATFELKNSYDLRMSLPIGYVTDGSVDYTPYIQLAINRHDNLRFPGFPILVNDNGLKIGSNKILYFEKGSEIWLKPSSKGKYNIFHLRKVKNVELINPVIKGDRNEHIGTSGEWGMGIGIYSSDNIKIINAKIYDCWGDGLCLATSGEATNNNIQIINIYCKNNRRNGITITSVNGLLLDSPYSGYTQGTDPQAGIDIEPDHPYDEVKNIKIIKPVTEYNKGAGITLSMSNMYGKEDKNVSVEISGHRDKSSNIGLRLSCYPYTQLASEEVRGRIIINNPTWIRNKKVPIQTALFQKDLKLKIYKPVILNKEGIKLSEPSIRRILAAKGHINPHANSLVIYR